MERLRFSRAEISHGVSLVESLSQLSRARQIQTSALKRCFRRPRPDEHLELLRIHVLADKASADDYRFALEQYRRWPPAEIEPDPLISGDDLIVLGFKPGPLFKEILMRVEDEQLEGRLTQSEEARQFVIRHYKKGQR